MAQLVGVDRAQPGPPGGGRHCLGDPAAGQRVVRGAVRHRPRQCPARGGAAL